LLVADGEDEASAEAVVEVVAAFLAKDEAGLFDERGVKVSGFGPIDGVVPGVRGVTEADKTDGFGGNGAAGEVIACDLAGLAGGEGGLPVLGDLLVDLEKAVFEVAGFRAAGLALCFDGDAGALGQ